jgi:hypothetical protein
MRRRERAVCHFNLAAVHILSAESSACLFAVIAHRQFTSQYLLGCPAAESTEAAGNERGSSCSRQECSRRVEPEAVSKNNEQKYEQAED